MGVAFSRGCAKGLTAALIIIRRRRKNTQIGENQNMKHEKSHGQAGEETSPRCPVKTTCLQNVTF